MRAAMIQAQGADPVLVDIDEPRPCEGALVVEVKVGAVGPTDVMKATGNTRPYPGPHVVNGEGAGRLADGSRVYFGHSIRPYGAWGEKTLVAAEEVWPIPEGVGDEQAAALVISGTGALIALEQAAVGPGDRVLVLGATGALGQIGLQVARAMGAGVLVAAGRNPVVLERIQRQGLADLTVRIGQGDDLAAVRSAAGDGWNVVLDAIYGKPAEAALKTTAIGARMVSCGRLAGLSMNVELGDLGFRTLAGVGTGIRPAAERRAAYGRLMTLAQAGQLALEVERYSLDQASQAWAALKSSPGRKVLLTF